MQKLSSFQQKQLENAQQQLIQSVSNYSQTLGSAYPTKSKDAKSLESDLNSAYQGALHLSRKQAQWLAKKTYSDSEKTAILMTMEKASKEKASKYYGVALTSGLVGVALAACNKPETAIIAFCLSAGIVMTAQKLQSAHAHTRTSFAKNNHIQAGLAHLMPRSL